MTLQGDALCQAVSTCHTSCFVLQGVITLWALQGGREGGHPGNVFPMISVPCQFSLIGLDVSATIDICQDPASDTPSTTTMWWWVLWSTSMGIPCLCHLCCVTSFLGELLCWGHMSCLDLDSLNAFQPILCINIVLWKHWGSDCARTAEGSLPGWSGGRECDCQPSSSAYRHFLLSYVCFFFQGC